jgi:hypothetical protein
MQIRFTKENKSPVVEIQLGEYTRKFEASKQPFECEDHEAAIAMATGLFETAPSGSGPNAPANQAESAGKTPVSVPAPASTAPKEQG